MMERIDLKTLSPAELENLVIELGWESFRARQIMSWLYQKRISDIDFMTNLSLRLRNELKRTAFISCLPPSQVLTSRDGTRKYLFSLGDGGCIESVLIPNRDHLTLCISTQRGCGLKCRFCYTGREGFIRDLTTAEIINQIESVLNHLGDTDRLRNIVFMGMGEPLDNYDNTLRALEIIFHPHGFNFSHRRVTLSSAGLIPELRRLGRDNPVNLAISLNAADNQTRSFLMPVN
ncbi:MAG: radical SAM protein, partial [Deltaproteobacteria bacterium]|nr:radical SAM protein [Deltaproteobacteria bacterium]